MTRANSSAKKKRSSRKIFLCHHRSNSVSYGCSQELVSVYGTLSFGAMPSANDADSTVRGERSVWVSAGAGDFGVMCPETTVGTFFSRELGNYSLRNHLPPQDLALDSSHQFAFLAVSLNRTGFSLSFQSWGHVGFSKHVRKLY